MTLSFPDFCGLENLNYTGKEGVIVIFIKKILETLDIKESQIKNSVNKFTLTEK